MTSPGQVSDTFSVFLPAQIKVQVLISDQGWQDGRVLFGSFYGADWYYGHAMVRQKVPVLMTMKAEPEPFLTSKNV